VARLWKALYGSTCTAVDIKSRLHNRSKWPCKAVPRTFFHVLLGTEWLAVGAHIQKSRCAGIQCASHQCKEPAISDLG